MPCAKPPCAPPLAEKPFLISVTVPATSETCVTAFPATPATLVIGMPVFSSIWPIPFVTCSVTPVLFATSPTVPPI